MAAYAQFHSLFHPLSLTTDESAAARKAAWSRLDINGNGHVSLAETDKWIQDELVNHFKEHGKELWKRFRPSYIRAFKDAADAGPNKKLSTTAAEDDYVEKKEFRLLCAYLPIYADLYDIFSAMDGGGEGVSADDDRKINRDEFEAGIGRLQKSHFTSCAEIDSGVFDQIDSNKGVRFISCSYLVLICWTNFVSY